MTAWDAVRVLLGLVLVATPAAATEQGACERAVAKASRKFVGAAMKSAQRCAVGRRTGTACPLTASASGGPADPAIAHAERRLEAALAPCSDATLAGMDFGTVCAGAASGTPARGGLARCIARTHLAAVQSMLAVEFPQGSACGNGVIDAGEDCDPRADPAGCSAGASCVAAGQTGECTCRGPAGAAAATPCDPACGTDQTCQCSCVGAASCGNGTRDSGEQCDPAASPTGCAPGTLCGPVGTAQECTCYTPPCPCGNGVLDPGEDCDPAMPNMCEPGEVCLATGSKACTCGAPPMACGNGVIEWGEECDPAAHPTGCPSSQVCGANCTCQIPPPG